MDSSLAGCTMVITGANTGIGRVTAETLARRGAHVVLACRSEQKTLPVMERIARDGGRASFVALDLGSLASVRGAAETLRSRHDKIHVLINNAGLAGLRDTTSDGFEIAFGTNHLGHFLLTTALLPALRAAAPARIVNVASRAHYKPKGIEFDRLREKTRSLTGIAEYGVSKLCNVLFTKELARGRAGAGVRSYALHPGVIASDVWRKVPALIRPLVTLRMMSTEEGAACSLYCATSSEIADHDGRYYDADCREKAPNPIANDEALARMLWEKSEAWTAA